MKGHGELYREVFNLFPYSSMYPGQNKLLYRMLVNKMCHYGYDLTVRVIKNEAPAITGKRDLIKLLSTGQSFLTGKTKEQKLPYTAYGIIQYLKSKYPMFQLSLQPGFDNQSDFIRNSLLALLMAYPAENVKEIIETRDFQSKHEICLYLKHFDDYHKEKFGHGKLNTCSGLKWEEKLKQPEKKPCNDLFGDIEWN